MKWEVPRYVRTTVVYPLKGKGALLTFIAIQCEQSTSEGEAYVISGGINQRFIKFDIVASNTDFFNYSILFYGKK